MPIFICDIPLKASQVIVHSARENKWSLDICTVFYPSQKEREERGRSSSDTDTTTSQVVFECVKCTCDHTYLAFAGWIVPLVLLTTTSTINACLSFLWPSNSGSAVRW